MHDTLEPAAPLAAKHPATKLLLVASHRRGRQKVPSCGKTTATEVLLAAGVGAEVDLTSPDSKIRQKYSFQYFSNLISWACAQHMWLHHISY